MQASKGEAFMNTNFSIVILFAYDSTKKKKFFVLQFGNFISN